MWKIKERKIIPKLKIFFEEPEALAEKKSNILFFFKLKKNILMFNIIYKIQSYIPYKIKNDGWSGVKKNYHAIKKIFSKNYF